MLITSVAPDIEQLFVAPVDDGTTLPDWMTSKICDDSTIGMSQEFVTALDDLAPLLDTRPDLNTLEIAVIRVLLVHSWRRIVLKVPVLPDCVFPDEWREPVCRAQVAELLSQYPKRRLDELEATMATLPSHLVRVI